MGAWVSYSYVTEILKSEVRISRIYQRHFCTVIYLPSIKSCDTNKLVSKHGRDIHELSGHRVGFLFIDECKFELHEGDPRPEPSANKIAQNWRYKTYYDCDRSMTIRSRSKYERCEETGPPIRDSHEIARQLGLLESTPCIVIICHYFSKHIYKYNLQHGTPEEILDFFNDFCSSFYDNNFIVFRALDTVEDSIDKLIYVRNEVEVLLKSLRGCFANIKSFSFPFDPLNLWQSVLSVRWYYSSIIKDYDSLLISGEMTIHGIIDEAELVLRLCSDLADLIQKLEIGSTRGMPFNETIQRVREIDERLLCRLQRKSEINLNFGAILSELENIPGRHLRRTLKLKAYLQKRHWMDVGFVSIGISADDIAPLFALLGIVRKIEAPYRNDVCNIHKSVTYALEDIRIRLLDVFASYRDLTCKNVEFLLDNLRQTIHNVEDWLRSESLTASKGEYLVRPGEEQRCRLADLKEALIELTGKVTVPAKWLEQLTVVPDVSSADRLEDIMSMFRSGNLSALLRRHESPFQCGVSPAANGLSGAKENASKTEQIIPHTSPNLATVIPSAPTATTPEISQEGRAVPPVKVLVITALPNEAAAVMGTLDALDEEPVSKADDPNIYGTGDYYLGGDRSRPRRVLIASQSRMGKTNASTLGANALRSFPSIEHIVMVGIAGGCPNPSRPEEHVRLGDIVVSNEKGVIEYDDIKLTAESIERRASLQRPSYKMLQAHRVLQARSMMKRRPWETYFESALPKLEESEGFARPDESHDVLHEGDDVVAHPDDVRRRSGHPRIHSGAIGTADILLKRPSIRDELRDRFGVRAIEMEASGLQTAAWAQGKDIMVIRGICDYCDKWKSDRWQAYAALIAASYARALIEILPKEWFTVTGV